MPYGYYYGGYGDFLANNIYCILLIPILLLSVWAQAQVSGNFKRYSTIAYKRHLTGAQAAEAVLRAHGIYNVSIRPCAGSLTDHYDPRDNSISLSQDVYNSATIAAVGVAAHEAGHAVQYAVGVRPGEAADSDHSRNAAWLQVFSSFCCCWDMILYVQPLFLFGIVLFSLTTIFLLLQRDQRAVRSVEFHRRVMS